MSAPRKGLPASTLPAAAPIEDSFSTICLGLR